jgi:hypothetical protein
MDARWNPGASERFRPFRTVPEPFSNTSADVYGKAEWPAKVLEKGSGTVRNGSVVAKQVVEHPLDVAHLRRVALEQPVGARGAVADEGKELAGGQWQ